MENLYTIGLDFGTLSCRSVLVDIGTGKIIGGKTYTYPHKVMTDCLPDGTPLPSAYALAYPRDYEDALFSIIPSTLSDSGVSGSQVIGIGIDATSPTVLPLDASGTPLCYRAEFVSNPHAYIKMWKHHGNTGFWADKMDAAEHDCGWREYYGGRINYEFVIPKALEVQNEAPEVWSACSRFCEVGDWLCSMLTGRSSASLMMSSCNGNYFHGSYPSDRFFEDVVPGRSPVKEKLSVPNASLGQSAGIIAPDAAKKLGVSASACIAPALIDSHASVLGCGAVRSGDLVAVLGTSGCYLLNSDKETPVSGACCVAWEANVPSLYGYESGQTCFGDGLNWITENTLSAEVLRERDNAAESIHQILQKKCAAYAPGASGLLILDWWNGVRSPLKRSDLTAVITGLNLKTGPEDIYHAGMEALCFGARRIIESYSNSGLAIKRFFAAGGIARKSPLLMQMLADVCGFPIMVCESDQTGALGSAVAAAIAAVGKDHAEALSETMSSKAAETYFPSERAHLLYNGLYEKYLDLSRRFENFPG